MRSGKCYNLMMEKRMNKNQIKKWIAEENPLVIKRRKKMRNKLINSDITFLCPNCIGGILFHDLGIKFMSPTVNLMMNQKEFLEFVLNLDTYLEGELAFFEHKEYTCPCAKLIANDLPEITVHFTHYKDKEHALTKWNERKRRINKNNIFIFIEERDGIMKKDIERLEKCNIARGIVAFTCNKYEDLPYTVYIPKYHSQGMVGNILKKNHFNGAREYEKYFDFVRWFNEAQKEEFSVKKYCKRIIN